MARHLAMAAAGVLLFVGTAPAAEPQPASTTSEILETLFKKEVKFPPNTDLSSMTVIDILSNLTNTYGIKFAINMESFKAVDLGDIAEKHPTIYSTGINGLTLHQFLVRAFNTIGATYVIKGGTVELVPAGRDENGNFTEEPLVCSIVNQEKMSAWLDLLARRYDLSVAITPAASEAAAKLISARIMNLPADKAIELMAFQCDLRVVRMGTAYLIATPAQALTMAEAQAQVKAVRRKEPKDDRLPAIAVPAGPDKR